ncbi:MAG: choice-of-anchor Q domain-containing protein [Thiogranum sp.]|nr:choice-of-anchor Q domain-containing protein [Thiogranum sp.]
MATSNNAAILDNLTITSNTADSDHDGVGDGGGILQGIAAPRISNSILADNLDSGGEAPDCAGAVDSQGYNLVGNDAGCTIASSTGDQIGTETNPLDPGLAPLDDNGGPTPTHALLNGSPALDSGNPALPGSGSGACQRVDQRRILRSEFAPCDIGALESTPTAGVTFTVNSTADQVDAAIGDGECETVPGNQTCTLRAAIQETNALVGPDRIILPAGNYLLGIAGIDEDFSASGDLDISDTLDLVGAGRASTIIDANQVDRVFHTRMNSALTLSGITIRNGNATYGGGLYHQATGTLTINDSAITDNSTTASGGGIYTVGFNHVVIVNRSLISNNAAAGYGGGIANFTFGTSLITDTIISGNSASTGGGIMNSFFSYAVIQGTTISDNQAQYGGGIGTLFGSGIVSVTNSTISGNRATFGGGGINISANDTVHLRSTTVTQNRAQMGADGGGINNSGLVNARNSIIAGNIDEGGEAPDCIGPITSHGHNLLGVDASCSFLATTGDLVGNSLVPLDALLAPLADNGGPGPTHALMPESPAFDAGDPAVPGSGDNACAASDQRGVDRIRNAPCDIGAVESIIADIGITASLDASPILPGAALRYTFQISNNGPDTALDLSLAVSVPDGASVASASGIGWTCDISGPPVSCTSSMLSSAAFSGVNIAILAPAASGPFNATATIAASTVDLDAANDSVSILAAVNAAPVLAAASTPAYTPGDPGIAVAEDLTVVDPDDSHLESAVVSISSGYVAGQDELAFSDTDSISGYWEPATGHLALIGTATLEAYESALRSVQYLNAETAAAPGSRSFSWQANDGSVDSDSVTTSLTLSEVIPEPVIEFNPDPVDNRPDPSPTETDNNSGGHTRLNNNDSSARDDISATEPEPQIDSPPADNVSAPEAAATEPETPQQATASQPETSATTPQNSPTISRRLVTKRSGDKNHPATASGVSPNDQRYNAHARTPGIVDDSGASVVSMALWTQLDAMREEMHQARETEDMQEKILAGTAKSATAILFAGFVNWYLKAGSLLASLLSSAPLWAPFDPLPILSVSRKELDRRRREKDNSESGDSENEPGPDALFDEQVSNTSNAASGSDKA